MSTVVELFGHSAESHEKSRCWNARLSVDAIR